MYTKTQWVDNTTPIDKDNLNKIEQGIYNNSLVVDAVTNTLNPTDTETYKTAELTEGQITDVIGVSDIVIKGQTSQNGEPTPSSPVDVNVVSGSNVINTSNKNWLSMNNGTVTDYNFNANIQNGIITVNGTPSSTPATISITLTQPIKLKQNNNIKINANNLSGIGTSSDYVSLRLSGIVNGILSDNIAEVRCVKANASSTFTATNDTIINQVRIRGNANVTFNNFIIKPQIELGTTATTYEPHQGKELSLNLGTIELCKIGNYQDYFYKSGSKWYLHKEIGKVVLDGSESSFSTVASSGSYYHISLLNVNNIKNFGSQRTTNIFINNFSKSTVDNYNSVFQYEDDIYFYLPEGMSTKQAFVDLLGSTNSVLYYVLNNTIDTEITNTTLISQLEAIYNAPLYEQTNITQTNNDLPMVLDITACKDNINGIKAFIRK